MQRVIETHGSVEVLVNREHEMLSNHMRGLL